VSVEELASRAGLSVRHLERRFQAVVGVSPKQHVIAVRLAAAQAMLRETPATVAEVAAATGFASAAHLTAAFTRRVGAPPAAWRAASVRGPGA
jgi:transcriptional regulator GlxA family with amidase domain